MRYVEVCRRCGGSHADLDEMRFVRPVPDVGGDFTHWASCPVTGDPILIRHASERRLEGCVAVYGCVLEGDEFRNLSGGELAAFLRSPHQASETFAGGDADPHDWDCVFVEAGD